MSEDEVVITPYRDGPLLVRGPFRLQDQDGNPIELGRETVALCRCGKSRIRPFCDGSHKLVRFSADGHRAPHVRVGKRLERPEHAIPTLVPRGHQRLPRLRRIDKLAIAIPVRLLAVAGQEIRPSRPHITRHVFDYNCD